jgi:hypothetical protein
MNYDRARARDEHRTARQGEALGGRRLDSIDNGGDRVTSQREDFS